MGTPVSLRAVTKTYPGAGRAAPLTVVDRVDLDIAGGEMFFLLGPSGCGKTTLLRMIAGFIEPTNGSILFGTEDVTFREPQRRNTGMVFQSYAIWPHMTVRSNVSFGLETRKTPASEAAARVDECLKLVQMESLSDRRPSQLSGGQQQRVALARAIAVKPDVLLLDEPLSNLDAKLRIELRSEIRRVCKAAGTTAIYVTHDQREALSIADRIALMRAGRIEQVGTPWDVYRFPTSAFSAGFMGEVNRIEGELVSRDANGRAVVRTRWGEVVGHAPLPVSGQVSVFVRPESLTPTEPRAPRSTWNSVEGVARAEDVSFLGEVWNLTAHTSDGVLRVTGLGSTPPPPPPPPGGQTRFWFPEESTTVLANGVD